MRQNAKKPALRGLGLFGGRRWVRLVQAVSQGGARQGSGAVDLDGDAGVKIGPALLALVGREIDAQRGSGGALPGERVDLAKLSQVVARAAGALLELGRCGHDGKTPISGRLVFF